VLNELNPATILKIGQCVAYAIIFTGSHKQLSDIVANTCNEKIELEDFPLRRMQLYLEIVNTVVEVSHLSKENSVSIYLNVERDANTSQNAQKLARFLNVVKEIKIESFVRMLQRYANDGNHAAQLVDEVMRLADLLIIKA